MAIGTPVVRGTATRTTIGTTIVTTLSSGVSIGERVFAFAGGRSGGMSGASCADSRGNTWALDANGVDGTGLNACCLLSALVTTALLTSDTVTVTGITGSSTEAVVFSVSGLDTAALDQTATTNGTWDASSHWTGGTTSTLAQADEFVFGGVCGSAFAAGNTPDAGYTMLQYVSSSGAPSGDRPIDTCYGIVSATTAVTPGATLAVSTFGGWCAVAATYKGVAAAVATGGRRSMVRRA